MLKRRFHLFCIKYRRYINLDFWGITSIAIITVTFLDLCYFLNTKNENESTSFTEFIKNMPALSKNRETNSSSNHFYRSIPILPEFGKYSENLKMALYDIYNRSFKELSKCKNGMSKNQLVPGVVSSRLILVSSWRSGSSFLSELLASHPASLLQTEPLTTLGIKRIFNTYDQDASAAYEIVSNVVKCNSSGLKEYVKPTQWPNIYWFHHERNSYYHWRCVGKQLKNYENICSDVNYLDEVCKALPVQVTKLVRANLKIISNVLTDESLEDTLKLLLLVRDPRAVIHSRKEFPWCQAAQDCYVPKNLCKDMVDDFHEAIRLIRLDSTRLKIIRYEDLIHSIKKISKDIFEFMHLEFQPITQDFIDKATHPNHNMNSKEKQSIHIRDPKSVTKRWMEEMEYTEIANIQRDCKEAMQIFGYNFIKSPKDLTNLDPVGKFQHGMS